MPRPRRRVLLPLLLALLAPSAALATVCPPSAAAYPSARWHAGHAAPQLVTGQQRLFRTVIRGGAVSGEGFADRYRLAVWGCGSSCQQAALVDTVSGWVLPVPDAALGYDARPGSRLLTVSPLQPGERLQDRRAGGLFPPPTFYVLTGGRLRQVCRPTP